MSEPLDEYQLEIRDIRRTLGRLKAEKAREELIAEYEAELRNLVALHDAARVTLEAGEDDGALPRALHELGFGDWTLENVYAFVYEAAMEAESDGRDLANVINHTDYAASLRAALGD
jgi:hypothetical protein